MHDVVETPEQITGIAAAYSGNSVASGRLEMTESFLRFEVLPFRTLRCPV